MENHDCALVADRALAFSNRIASFTDSATKVLRTASPNEANMRRLKPPTKPFTPTKATPFRNDLLRLVSLPCNCSPPCCQKTYLKSDHFLGAHLARTTNACSTAF